MFKKRPIVFLLLLAGCQGSGSPGTPSIHLEGAWARAMPAGGNSAVYLTLENKGSGDDRLLGGEVEGVAALEIHESRMEGDVMRMRQVEAVELSPGGRVSLQPGGLHLMLLGLSRPLEVGDTLTMTLRFQLSEPLVVSVPVRSPGGS
jgi:copper(I)-binding protein